MPNARYHEHLRRSRIALFSVLIPMLPLAFTLGGAVQSFLRLAYILLGFSLIIFLHELGHFVVARACSVKCLAFSIGIGPRMLGWRKGAGVSFGKDPYDPDTAKKSDGTGEKTLGEIEDEKSALKSLDADKPVVMTEKGPVQIEPNTKNLTADILGKPADTSAEKKLEHFEAATTHSDLPTSAEIPPHPGTVGDTDYRISWLPLGGYVRMLGQDDMDPTKVSNDPNAFNRRPIWQRMCIVSAGVIMNVIFAAVVFSIIFSPGIGVEFPPAIVGVVTKDSPADKAGLKIGDQVLSINGQKPLGQLEFTDLQMIAALSNGTEAIRLEVKPADGGPTVVKSIVPTRSDATGFLAFGVDPMPGTKIGGSADDYLIKDSSKDNDRLKKLLRYSLNEDAFKKIRNGDKITAIDGKNVDMDYVALYNYLQSKNGQPVKLTVTNVKDAKLPAQELTLYPHLEHLPGVSGYPTALGLSPRLRADEALKGSPAEKAGLKPDDYIVRVGQRTSPTVNQFIDIVGESAGNPLPITIVRDGKEETVTVTPRNEKGTYRIGLQIEQDLFSTAFGAPVKDSEADALNLPSNATIAKVDGQPVETWADIYGILRGKNAGDKVAVAFNTGSSELVTRDLTLSGDEAKEMHDTLHYLLGMRLEHKTITQKGQNAGEAVMMGVEHTKKFILQVYMTLAGLFRQTISPTNLHGIVGITKIGYDVQERGTVWLWYVLAMVSVNLAVANFLPLPIVDGGLFLLLILEKIRGRPLSLKVQSAIQVVGIVLLAGLFLFVTWNDIGLFTK